MTTLDFFFFNYCSLSALYTLMVLPTLTLSGTALKVDASASEKLPYEHANSANTISGSPHSTSHDLGIHHFNCSETPEALLNPADLSSGKKNPAVTCKPAPVTTAGKR